ncbi:MAG TPA: hypothetical protein VJX70_00660 [Candidatus Acidoferrum sp.]|nr:hypothetical protein [Candidatus Acidoferrum sp.]
MAKTMQTIDTVGSRTRSWKEEAEMLLSLLNCVVLDREAVYASSEFTTGRRFYGLCRQYSVTTAEDLKRRLGGEYLDKLLNANKDDGIRFARKLREFGHSIVLTPNPFHADPLNLRRNWTQTEYLDFWNLVISKKCHAVYFNEGWQFSNGCTFEFLAGLKAGVLLFDHCGERLEFGAAIEMIAAAIETLESDGFRVPKLREVLAELSSLSS